MRAPGSRKARRPAPAAAAISVRLSGHVTLQAQADGKLAAIVQGHPVGLGTFSAAAVKRAQELLAGLPLRALKSGGRGVAKELAVVVGRLARLGLVEYRLGRSGAGADRVVIEPQLPGYWPQTPKLRDTDVLALSRFAYLRRRGSDLVLESPRAGALFKIGEPKIAAAIAALATPQPIKKLRRLAGFPGLDLFALLVDCQILFKIGRKGDDGQRASEGDHSLVMWDFHDLVFHARCTEGRHANPLGGVYPYEGVIAPLPAVRPRWPGKAIDLASAAASEPTSPAAALLRARHSVRSFDAGRPVTLAELSRFLDATARVQSTWEGKIDDASPAVAYAMRPYPSGGGSYELELYLAVDACEGLPRGFYHYDAGAHALVPIAIHAQDFDALLAGAEFAMAASAVPQIVFTIAARFGRVSWKYSSVAYGLILKDVGVLLQTFYLMATEMGLGGCAIGSTNIDLFARMTGLPFHVEGAVGQFAFGRGAESETFGK